MSQSFSDIPIKKRVLFIIGLPAWVFFGFALAQALIVAVIQGLGAIGVSFESVNTALFNAVGAAIIYALAIALVLGLPWLIRRNTTSKDELGLQRMPSWMDLVWAPAGMVAYLILTAVVTVISDRKSVV